MSQSPYQPPKPTRIIRLFWKAAGADAKILERCTYSDHVKYAALGGIVVATGIMAAFAGGYAFYTIFQPKGPAMENAVSWQTGAASAVFGLLWGLMIFNLDRFIVASTGKGDGTEKITRQELVGALPRILMGMIIAISISKPMEIRIFKTEIDIKLHEKQIEQVAEYKTKTEAIYTASIDSSKAKINRLSAEISQKTEKRDELSAKLEEEIAGRVGSGLGGVGPAAKKIEANLARMQEELDAIKQRNQPMIEDEERKIRDVEAKLDEALNQSEDVAAGMDGLLERIKLGHEVAGPTISWFITLLFMSIELTPIFFKLMLTKSPYDYLSENAGNLIKAEQGIEIQYDFYEDEKGVFSDKIVFHAADQLIREKAELMKAQQELSAYVVEKWKEAEKKKIDENPEKYMGFGNDKPA